MAYNRANLLRQIRPAKDRDVNNFDHFKAAIEHAGDFEDYKEGLFLIRYSPMFKTQMEAWTTATIHEYQSY